MNPLPSTFSYFCLDYIYFVELNEFFWKSVGSTRHYTWIMLHYSWILIVKLNYVWIMMCFHYPWKVQRQQHPGNVFRWPGQGLHYLGKCFPDQLKDNIIWANWTLFSNNETYYPWLIIITTRKRSLGQGNVFTPVCHSVHKGVSLSQHASQVTWQVGLYPEGSLSRGHLSRLISVQGVSVQGVLCPEGLCLGVSVQGVSFQLGSLSRGSLSRGVSVKGSLSRGVSVQGVSVQVGGLCQADPPYGNEQMVRILLECILIFYRIYLIQRIRQKSKQKLEKVDYLILLTPNVMQVAVTIKICI